MKRRGSILLEMLIAVSILVMASLAISGSLRDALSSLQRSQDEAKAGDIARSVLAQLEAGMARPELFNGPLTAWEGESDRFEGDALVDELAFSQPDGLAVEDDWFVTVETEPSGFAGLTSVTVIVERVDEAGEAIVRRSLTQFVRLREGAEDTIGGEGELSELADEARAAGGRGRR